MITTVEVSAGVTCPFTHMGLKLVAAPSTPLGRDVEIQVRACLLEWVNSTSSDPTALAARIDAPKAQTGIEDFAGSSSDQWPDTTIPVLNVAAATYTTDPSTDPNQAIVDD
jgi:hypothetical protein